MDHSSAQTDTTDFIHGFGNETEAETCLSVCLYRLIGSHQYPGVFHGVVVIVSLDNEKLQQSKSEVSRVPMGAKHP
jgi:hypothetical protein